MEGMNHRLIIKIKIIIRRGMSIIERVISSGTWEILGIIERDSKIKIKIKIEILSIIERGSLPKRGVSLKLKGARYASTSWTL